MLISVEIVGKGKNMNNIKTLLCLVMAFCFLGGSIEAKEKKYKNGDFYSGEWQKGKPEGTGKMIYANGSIYVGLWHDGKIAGEGSIIEGSNKFEGTFIPVYENEEMVKFKPVKGTFTIQDSQFVGEWDEQNLFRGILTNKDISFKGILDFDKSIFKEGRIDGRDGSYIEGSMLLTPKFEGKVGKYVLQKTSVLDVPAVYTGEFTNGKFLGHISGSQYSNTINEFEIDVDENGNQHGYLSPKNGGKYKGYIKNKKFDGEGILELKDGSLSGTWSNGILTDGMIKQSDINRKTYEFPVIGGKATYTFPENGKTITLNSTLDGNSILYLEVAKYEKENTEITVKEPNTILSYIKYDLKNN